jgi:hypothetical protein
MLGRNSASRNIAIERCTAAATRLAELVQVYDQAFGLQNAPISFTHAGLHASPHIRWLIVEFLYRSRYSAASHAGRRRHRQVSAVPGGRKSLGSPFRSGGTREYLANSRESTAGDLLSSQHWAVRQPLVETSAGCSVSGGSCARSSARFVSYRHRKF